MLMVLEHSGVNIESVTLHTCMMKEAWSDREGLHSANGIIFP